MHIWILEDEILLAKSTWKKLERQWFNVSIAHLISDFKKLPVSQIDLFIIDITVPDGTGFEVINWLRNEKNITCPIIITSAYSDTDNKIFGLHVWADDYMTKPIEPDELIARIKALIRRSFQLSPSQEIHYKDFVYNVEYKKLTHEWKEIDLTKKEHDIIEYFFVNQWKVVSKNVLVSTIWWNYDFAEVSDNTINVTISRLRKKLWESFHLSTVVWAWYSLKI